MADTGFEHNGVWIADPTKSPCGRFDLTPEQSQKEYGMKTIQEKSILAFEGFWEDLDIPAEWDNVSYHNDACPSWEHNGWMIMVDHIDPKQSECRDEGDPRFYVFKACHYSDSHEKEGSEEFHDFDAVLKKVAVYAHSEEAIDFANEIIDGGYPITVEALKEACMEKMGAFFGTKFDKDHKRFNQEVYNNIVEHGSRC